MKFKKSLFLISVFILSIISFSGCKNFLNGSKLNADLNDEINYLNAKSSSIMIKCESDEGSYLKSGEMICKVGYSIDVVFYVNTDLYILKEFRAVSIKDKNISRKEFVDITDVSDEKEKKRWN